MQESTLSWVVEASDLGDRSLRLVEGALVVLQRQQPRRRLHCGKVARAVGGMRRGGQGNRGARVNEICLGELGG
jgi:hypothetical protein